MMVVISWSPFPGPTFDRVMVCGWSNATQTCQGYWWYQEDVCDENGIPMEKPDALYWAPLILPPFPKEPRP